MVNSIQKLIHEFSKLPGIGEKTALRFAFHLLRQQPQYAEDLARAILEVKERVRLCSICCALTDVDPCPICHYPKLY